LTPADSSQWYTVATTPVQFRQKQETFRRVVTLATRITLMFTGFFILVATLVEALGPHPDFRGGFWPARAAGCVCGLYGLYAIFRALRNADTRKEPARRPTDGQIAMAALDASMKTFHTGEEGSRPTPDVWPPGTYLTYSRPLDPKYHIEVRSTVGSIVHNVHIVKSSNGQAIPPDEPVMLFRARDALAYRVLAYYRDLCIEDGCTTHHVDAIRNRIQAFMDFSRKHPERMKQPGVTRGL
jgi:hypothetical protein